MQFKNYDDDLAETRAKIVTSAGNKPNNMIAGFHVTICGKENKQWNYNEDELQMPGTTSRNLAKCSPYNEIPAPSRQIFLNREQTSSLSVQAHAFVSAGEKSPSFPV